MDSSRIYKNIKIFVRSFLFVLILFFLVAGLFVLSATSFAKNFFSTITGSGENLYYGYYATIPTIEQVQEENQYTKLIVGDSVCNQLFNRLQEYNDEYCIAGSNRAIGVSGQYILIREFLDAHPDATDVYLMLRPLSLDAQFDTQTGYMYAVAPFVATGTFQLEDATIKEVKQTYGAYSIWPIVTEVLVNSPMAAKAYLNNLTENHYVDTYGEKRVTEISYQYLVKIMELCEENDVKIHMIAMPMADLEPNHLQVEEVDTYLKNGDVCETVSGFCDTLIYYPGEYFWDGQHLDSEKIDFDDVIREIRENTGELTDLKLSDEV